MPEIRVQGVRIDAYTYAAKLTTIIYILNYHFIK